VNAARQGSGGVQGDGAEALVQRLRRAGKRVRVTLAVPRAGRVVLAPRLQVGERTLTQKARRVSVGRERVLTVTLRLSRKLERALQRRGRGRLTVRATHVARDGERTTQSRTLRMRAAR
jgi:hypothetical protein